MGLRQCDKCDEMVDEAKAFCPGCGNAFVDEEQRQDVSGFERLDHTVKLGDTMYNQMLSDMGLKVSKAHKPEKRVEVIAPIETAPVPRREPPKAPATAERSSKVLWIVLGVLGLLVLLPAAVIAAIILARAVLARF